MSKNNKTVKAAILDDDDDDEVISDDEDGDEGEGGDDEDPTEAVLRLVDSVKKQTPPADDVKTVIKQSKVTKKTADKTVIDKTPTITPPVAAPIVVKATAMTQEDAEVEEIKKQIIRDEEALAAKKSEEEKGKDLQPKYEDRNEYFVDLTFKDGSTRRIRPYVDKEFSFICQGFDDHRKEHCYRYIKSLTFNQVVEFAKFISIHGCICGDKINHKITVDSALDQAFLGILTIPREYDKRFIEYYMKWYSNRHINEINV